MIGQRKRCEQSVHGKKDYPQIPVAHLSDWRPTANAAVLLDLLLYRMIDDALNPLILNNSAVGPNTHCLKVLSGFHCGVLVESSSPISSAQSTHHFLAWNRRYYTVLYFLVTPLSLFRPQRVNPLLILSVQAFKQMFRQHRPSTRRQRQGGANYFFVCAHRFLRSQLCIEQLNINIVFGIVPNAIERWFAGL
jgi:hypothetical protein